MHLIKLEENVWINPEMISSVVKRMNGERARYEVVVDGKEFIVDDAEGVHVLEGVGE